jgi:hypothetical protein
MEPIDVRPWPRTGIARRVRLDLHGICINLDQIDPSQAVNMVRLSGVQARVA